MSLLSRLLDAMGPAFVDRAGPGLEPLVDGLTRQLQPADELLTTTDRGWPAAFDLEQTPQPSWIGTATGTKVPAGLTLEEQRAFVRDRAAWRRGTPDAIRGAVRSVLTPTNSRRVDLLERTTSPWRLTVRVWAAELPAGGVDAVQIAARTQTPVGIVLDDVDVQSGASYEHMHEYHGPTYEDALELFPTYDDAAPDEDTSVYHVPEEGSDN